MAVWIAVDGICHISFLFANREDQTQQEETVVMVGYDYPPHPTYVGAKVVEFR